MNQLHILKAFRHLRGRKKKSSERLVIALVSLAFLGGAALLIISAWVSMNARSVADVLPAQKTVAYLEVGELNLPPKLAQSGQWDLGELEALAKKLYDTDYKAALQTWATTPFGIALVQDEGDHSQVVMVSKLKSRRKALSYFEALALPSETLVKEKIGRSLLYKYPESQPIVVGISGAYLIASSSESVVRSLLEQSAEGFTSLANDPEFQKTFAHLPRHGLLKIYVNATAVKLANERLMQSVVTPIKFVVQHAGLTVRNHSNGFLINQFLNLNPEYLKLKTADMDRTPFAYGLTRYLSGSNMLAYFGGANLAAEWQSTLGSINALNPTYGILMEGLLRAQVNRVFGRNVDLETDLYPLFGGEYAVALSRQESGHLGTTLLLGHDDPEFIQAKMEKLYKGFRLLAAQFAPRVEVFVLPDGTESRELMADPQSVSETIEEYKGYEIPCLEVSDSAYGFCYIITNQLVMLSNNLESIQKIVDLSLNPVGTLEESRAFRVTLSNLSKISDEIGFLNLENIRGYYKGGALGFFLSPYLKPFEAITWVKHYFEDGMSAEGYLLLK